MVDHFLRHLTTGKRMHMCMWMGKNSKYSKCKVFFFSFSPTYPVCLKVIKPIPYAHITKYHDFAAAPQNKVGYIHPRVCLYLSSHSHIKKFSIDLILKSKLLGNKSRIFWKTTQRLTDTRTRRNLRANKWSRNATSWVLLNLSRRHPNHYGSSQGHGRTPKWWYRLPCKGQASLLCETKSPKRWSKITCPFPAVRPLIISSSPASSSGVLPLTIWQTEHVSI